MLPHISLARVLNSIADSCQDIPTKFQFNFQETTIVLIQQQTTPLTDTFKQPKDVVQALARNA
jgi:hypothetical protein